MTRCGLKPDLSPGLLPPLFSGLVTEAFGKNLWNKVFMDRLLTCLLPITQCRHAGSMGILVAFFNCDTLLGALWFPPPTELTSMFHRNMFVYEKENFKIMIKSINLLIN